VTSANERERAMRRQARGADAVIMAAAVADFRPARASGTKLPRRARLTLTLEATPDIVARLPRRPGRVVAGFALETPGRWVGEVKRDDLWKALEDLRFPRETIDKVVKLVRWHMFFSDPEQITLSAVRRMIKNVGEENIWDLLNLRICDRIGTGRPKEQPFRFRKYKAMVEQALRDPISVAMLKTDGNRLMKMFHVNPGPRIGWTLNALLEEILEDSSKNTEEYLDERAEKFLRMPDDELKKLGESGKDRREAAEDEEIKHIMEKHHVC